MISVLIPTFNEASNILDCLRSVAWADQIVVVDSCSVDDTRSIASGFGAEVVDFSWNGLWPKKKNWALENIAWRNEWLLILDADECITPALAREIQAATAASPLDGYFINRRFLFMGRWIRHCGYYPSWNLRLFRPAAGRYEKFLTTDTASGDNEIHEHLVMSGRTGYLYNDMLHLAYPDIFTWVEKHNRYSNWEAHVELSGERRKAASSLGMPAWKRRVKSWSRQLPFRPGLRFFYHYVLRRGFLDGFEGYALCRLLGMYELLTVMKKRELDHLGNDKPQRIACSKGTEVGRDVPIAPLTEIQEQEFNPPTDPNKYRVGSIFERPKHGSAGKQRDRNALRISEPQAPAPAA